MEFIFDCFKCGKCCNAGPALSVDEAFKYQEMFIIGLRYQVQHYEQYGKLIAGWMDGQIFSSKDMALFVDRLREIFPAIHGGSNGSFLNVYPFVSGYSLAPGNMCEALGESMECKLHNDKPTMCKSVPFDPIMPESLQFYTLRRFKEYGCISEGNSESVSQRIVYRNGEIVDPEFRSAFQSRFSDISNEKGGVAFVALSMKEGSPMAPNLSMVMNSAAAGGWVETEMSPLLFYMALNDFHMIGPINSFIENQINLIGGEIEKAIVRQNKQERDRTRVLRNYVNAYRRTLKIINSEDFPRQNMPIK